jgi:hypothetical protein
MADGRRGRAEVLPAADAVANGLRRFVGAGARHLVCRIGVLGSEPFLDQLERLRLVREALTG